MEEIKLDNGFKLYLIPYPNVNVVHVDLIVHAGEVLETSKTLEYSHFLEHLMIETSKKYPKEKILEELDKKGVDYNAITDDESTIFYFYGDKNHTNFIIKNVLTYITSDIKFYPEVFKREKSALLEELGSYIDDHEYILEEKTTGICFPKSILAKNTKLRMKSIKDSKLSEIKDYYKKYYSPSNSCLLVIGNFNKKDVKSLVTKTLSGIKSKKVVKFPMLKFPKSLPIERKVKSKKVDKTYCNMVYLNRIESYSKDFFIGKFMEYFLTEGLISLLQYKLRIEHDYIYSIKSDLDFNNYGSYFVIEFNTSNKNFEKVIQIIKDELRSKITKKFYKIAYEKINSDYNKLVGQTDISDLAEFYRDQISFGLRTKIRSEKYYYQQLLKVKSKDLENFASKYLIPEKMVIVYMSK